VKAQTHIEHRTVSPARAAAFDILLRIERESSYAPELLHSRICNRLSTVDHALATELVMGVLRWRSLLDSRIAAISSQPITQVDAEVLTSMRLGAYQLGWLTRIPAHAAINESVELVKRARKRSAASFVNAVLRKMLQNAHATADSAISGASVHELAATSAHPEWLVERWVRSYGLDAAARICRYNQSVPATAIRLRQTKGNGGPGLEEQLRSEDIELAPGALLASARRVLRGDITRSSVFRDGLCVIQDEASQLVAALLGQGARILDCCAAPGGKSGLIADNNPNSETVAVELHPHRARLLRKLLNNPAGNAEPSNIHVVSADARHLPFSTEFDRVLGDVPCSGTGTLARNPEIKWRLAPEDLTDLQARQLGILRSAMDHVSTGGRAVYSTCSLEKEENEDVIERAMREDSSFRVVDCSEELDRLRQQGVLIWPGPSLTRGPYLRTLPGVHPCDGFFAAILEKASVRN
jgi:16S rRNA (cytosine967-C5)-methyltransferase